MIRLHIALAGGLLLFGSVVAVSAPASAQNGPYCPTRQSVFGTLQSSQGNTLSVRFTDGSTGPIVIERNAQINAHGYAMRPGIFVGAFGCASPNGVFHASQVNLAADASRYSEQITGTVQRIVSDRLYVYQPVDRMTGMWFVPDIDEYHVGQTVTGIGMMGENGEFYPRTVNGHATAFRAGTAPQVARPEITRSGVIQRIAAGMLFVWEPAYRTTSTWIVRNSGAFRVGQHVVATGTENRRGDFYPTSIH